MRIPSRRASFAALAPVLLVAASGIGCTKRNLQLGDGRIDLDAGSDQLPGSPDGARDGAPDFTGAAPDSGSVPPPDAAEGECVRSVVALPWTDSSATDLAVVTSTNAVAVMNRRPNQLDVRTYARDGAPIAGFQFGGGAQFLPYRDDRFLLVARGTTGDFVVTALGADLAGGTRLYTAVASATEHTLGAIGLPATTIVITDEHFVNVGSGRFVDWSTVLGAADRDTFKSGRLYGMAAQADRVLLAWGAGDALRVAVIDLSGQLLARADDDSFLGYLGAETTTAIPHSGGLLMFDGNPVRLTQIGFDLSRNVLGENTQLRTFYRSAPRIAAISLFGRPFAFWLTVFPGNDNSQGSTPHQLYGCELDIADPTTCIRPSLIASTGLGGYGIEAEPVAAAVLPGDGALALAHTDAAGRSWLRLADVGCMTDRGPIP
jgi:hypothetical protein